MKLKTILNENTGELLVVDVQPAHQDHITFDLYEFTDYLNSYKGKINYVFNGPDLGYEDESELIEWLFEHDLKEETLSNIKFIEKNYGWIRTAIDDGDDEEIILELLRYMIENDYMDAREISEQEKGDLSENVLDFIDFDDGFCLPNIIDEMKNFNKCTVVGGGADECLLEMEITLNALNIKNKRNNKFIY